MKIYKITQQILMIILIVISIVRMFLEEPFNMDNITILALSLTILLEVSFKE